jgi:cell fate regulator YaaT (PSP1 superfamily)
MCCLRYEDKVYEEENARTPKVGSIVETPEGRGHVVERNVLKGTVKVSLDLAPEAAAQPYSRDDIKVIGFNKQKSDEEALDENLDELKDAEG